MTVAVGLHRVFTVENIARDEFEDHGSRLMTELLALERVGSVADSAVSLDLDNRRVEIEVIGLGPSFDEAAETADAAIRSAIHAAGGATPGWVVVTQEKHAELVDA